MADMANQVYRHMQDCFRQYPEIYGAEIADDETETPTLEGAVAKEGSEAPAQSAASATQSEETPVEAKAATPAPETKQAEPEQQQKAETEKVVPKAAHDAIEANEDKN